MHYYDESSKIKHNYITPAWIAENGDFRREKVVDLDAFDPSAPFLPGGKTYRFKTNLSQIMEDPFDLKNLRFIDPALVRMKWSHLERLAACEDDKDVVCMIGIGGTIAMKPNASGILEPVLDPKYLLDYAGNGLKDRFSVASFEFPTPMDSSQGEIDYAADLTIAMSWIWKNASERLRKRFTGFLITHGTDTMSGGSCYQKMMLGPYCPFSVGMIGAQRCIDPTGLRYSDVSINVVNSFQTLKVLKKKNQVAIFSYSGGTSGGAYDPVGIVKYTDSLPGYLESHTHPLILNANHFGEDGIRLPFADKLKRHLSRRNIDAIDMEEMFWPIILRGYDKDYTVESKMGASPQFHTRNILSSPPSETIAVILTAYGSFTANNKLRIAIMRAAQATGKLFLAASPFPDGKTDESNYGPAEELKEHAVHILPIALSAKITLGWHIYGNDIEKLKDFILHSNYVGEQIPSEWGKLTKKTPEGHLSLGAPKEVYERI